MPVFRRIGFYILLALVVASCVSKKAAKKKQFANNDYYFNPNIALVHSSNDSSLITIEFGGADILYARKHSSEPFKGNLTAEIIDEFGSPDTTKLTMKPPFKEEEGDWRMQVPFPTHYGKHHITILLKDQNRRAQYKKEYTFTKSANASTLDAEITEGRYYTPIYGNYFNVGDTINVRFPRFEHSENSPLTFYELIALPALPPPRLFE